MHIVLILAIIANILSIIMLPIGIFYNFNRPKDKAAYGYLIAGCVIMYMITLSIALIYGIFKEQYLYSLILFLCIISHFIIGKFVKYETLKKYTVAQIMCYVVSLMTMLLV